MGALSVGTSLCQAALGVAGAGGAVHLEELVFVHGGAQCREGFGCCGAETQGRGLLRGTLCGGSAAGVLEELDVGLEWSIASRGKEVKSDGWSVWINGCTSNC